MVCYNLIQAGIDFLQSRKTVSARILNFTNKGREE